MSRSRRTFDPSAVDSNHEGRLPSVSSSYNTSVQAMKPRNELDSLHFNKLGSLYGTNNPIMRMHNIHSIFLVSNIVVRVLTVYIENNDTIENSSLVFGNIPTRILRLRCGT